jgi:hypothetical protein
MAYNYIGVFIYNIDGNMFLDGQAASSSVTVQPGVMTFASPVPAPQGCDFTGTGWLIEYGTSPLPSGGCNISNLAQNQFLNGQQTGNPQVNLAPNTDPSQYEGTSWAFSQTADGQYMIQCQTGGFLQLLNGTVQLAQHDNTPGTTWSLYLIQAASWESVNLLMGSANI